MLSSVSQKPRSSIGFSAVPVQTLKRMIGNQYLTEVYTHSLGHDNKPMVAVTLQDIGHNSELATKDNRILEGRARTRGQALKQIADSLNIGDTLHRFDTRTPVAVVTDTRIPFIRGEVVPIPQFIAVFLEALKGTKK